MIPDNSVKYLLFRIDGEDSEIMPNFPKYFNLSSIYTLVCDILLIINIGDVKMSRSPATFMNEKINIKFKNSLSLD